MTTSPKTALMKRTGAPSAPDTPPARGTAMGGRGAAVRLDGVSKRYGDMTAVDGVSLDIEGGQFITLLGASGSGKTTLLRVIAGFLEATSGRIVMDGQDIGRVPVQRRHIGMVFQNYALFPHMSVARNVAFPLAMKKVPRRERAALVAEALAAVHLGGYEARIPGELSGGQQQRVAVARAIVARPRLLLMDEPLGALDRRLRESLQIEMVRLSRELGLTVINVTHDQEEALTMSDRIALLADGKLAQWGTPQELYDNPASEVVARFLGESNLFRGPVRGTGDDAQLDVSAGRVLVAPRADGSWPKAGETAVVIVRPSHARLVSRDATSAIDPASSWVTGRVVAAVFAGESSKVIVESADGAELVVRLPRNAKSAFGPGDDVAVIWNGADAVTLAAR